MEDAGPAAGHLVAPDEGGPDVVVSVEGRQVRSAAELRDAVARVGSGKVVTLRVYNAQAQAYRVERVRVG